MLRAMRDARVGRKTEEIVTQGRRTREGTRKKMEKPVESYTHEEKGNPLCTLVHNVCARDRKLSDGDEGEGCE